MGVLDLFSSEVWKGRHPALVLGWRDDQLAPVVELLRTGDPKVAPSYDLLSRYNADGPW